MDHASRPHIFVGMLTSEAEPWTWARSRLNSAGAKRSRLKVGPQLRFRVCDSLLLLAWQVSFWSASHQRAACKQKYNYRYSLYSRVVGVRCFSSKNASGSPVIKHYCILSDHIRCTWDKNEKDDFGDDDTRNPTKLCLASASLHQHRSPAAVGLWLWRKQQIRDNGKTEMGHVVWQTRYYLGFPDVHMKEQCWLLCAGRLEQYPLRKGLTLMSGSMKLTPHLHDAKHFVGYSWIFKFAY